MSKNSVEKLQLGEHRKRCCSESRTAGLQSTSPHKPELFAEAHKIYLLSGPDHLLELHCNCSCHSPLWFVPTNEKILYNQTFASASQSTVIQKYLYRKDNLFLLPFDDLHQKPVILHLSLSAHFSIYSKQTAAFVFN